MLKQSVKRKTISTAVAFAASFMSAGAAHAAVLEEVIVEAQKKSETITETPISIQVVTGEQLQKTASFSLSELSRSVAGLAITQGGSPDIRMRGISSITAGNVSLRTNFYQDGVLIELLRGVFDAQFDLASVEVLKGAQGTLYSSSSPTGTINIRTQNPNLTRVDGYVQSSVGDHGLFNTQFGLSLPIIENELAVRIAGFYDDNETVGVKNITTGHDSLSRESGGRLTTLWEPNSDFSARFSYQYREKKELTLLVEDGAGLSYDQAKLHTNLDDTVRMQNQLGTLELSYVIADHLSINSVSSYLSQKFSGLQDTDGLTAPIDPAGAALVGDTFGDALLNTPILRPIWQEDLRLSSEDNNFWDWQAGVFYQRTESGTSIDSFNYKRIDAQITTYTHTELAAHFSKEQFSYYTHNTFKFTDQLSLIAGVRYGRTRFGTDQPGVANTTISPAIYQPLAPPLLLTGVAPEQRSTTEYPVSASVKLQYFITPDTMTYISRDRSPRGGAANVNLTADLPSDLIIIKPEVANSWEVGLKSNFADGAGRYSVAIYDQVYKDFQQDVQNSAQINTATGAPGVLVSAVQNAAEAETRGVEVGLTWQFTDNWSVDTNAVYSDAKFTDYKNAVSATGGPGCSLSSSSNNFAYIGCDLSGQALPMAPKWAGNVSTEYTRSAFGDADWYVSGLINTQSDVLDKLTRRTLPGFSTVDVFTGLRSHSCWDMKFWVKNAFDKRVIIRVVRANQPTAITATGAPDTTQPTFDMVNLNNPRQLGVTGTYRF
jgi:iron complex outermembrane receptor protein